MEERLDEKKLPAIRATLAEPMLPLKIGSVEGVICWKIDRHRLFNFIAASKSHEEQCFYQKVMVDAEKAGMLID